MNSFESFFQEVVALFHRLRLATEQLHGGNELTAGRRGVMLSLLNGGPRTVPQLARARPVSRQHIRTIVTPMVKEGLLELVDNPNHKRSPLVQLTERGRKSITQMRMKEETLFAALDSHFDVRELHEAADTLRRVREFFDGDWQAAKAMSPKTKARMKQ